MNPSKKKRLVSDAPLAALLAIAGVVACGNASHAARATKASLVDAHANAVFDDDEVDTTDETVLIESTPSEIPRTPVHVRAPVSFTRG